MAFLLLLHEKMRLKRKVNTMTLRQVRISHRKERMTKKIAQVQKMYANKLTQLENKRIDKELQQLDEERVKANETIKKKNKEVLDTTVAGLNDQLKMMNVKNVEFKDAGNGLVQMYVDGVKQGKPLALNEATNIVNGTNQNLRNGRWGAEEAGKYLSEGFSKGIGSMGWTVRNAAANIAYQAQQAMKDALQIHSPSRVAMEIGKYFTQGFDVGIEKGQDATIKGVRSYSESIVDELASQNFNGALNDIYGSMKRAVDLETGKINASVDIGNASKNVNQLISASATFDGLIPLQVDLDGEVIYDNQQKVSARKALQYGGSQ